MIRPDNIKPVWDCTKCSLHTFATKPVWGRGPQKPLFILVGEGPGKQEDEHRMPFYPDAPAGALLQGILDEIGVNRNEIYITNATRCFKGWPTEGGGDISVEQIKACKPYLQDEIDKLDCDYIVPVGNEALKSILGHVGITKEHGRLRVGPNGKKYFPILHPASALPNRTPDNRNKIRDALKELVNRIKGGGDVLDKFDCKIIDSKSKFDKFEKEINSLPEHTIVCSDYETNSVKSPFHMKDGYIVSGASFVWEETGGYFLPLDHQNPANIWSPLDYGQVADFFRWYARSPFRKCNQNIKYEYNVTRGYFGVRYRRVFTDPMLLSHLLRPEPGTHGLEKLAWHVGMGGYDSPLEQWFLDNKVPEGKRDYTLVPLDILGRYAIGDGICALKYHNKFYPEILKRKQKKLYHERMMAVAPYANMEAVGMLIDTAYLDELDGYYVKLHAGMRIDMRRMLRETKFAVDKKFNFDSPAEIAKIIHGWFKLEKLRQRQLATSVTLHGIKRLKDRNKVSTDPIDYVSFNQNGLVSTEKSSIKGIIAYCDIDDDQREFITLFRDYRGGRTRYTRNVKGIRKFICYDGRVRSGLLMHGTVHSRRSSKDPNQQNIPRDPIVKRTFVAAEWYLFGINDYRNLEVRIAAAKSGDKYLLAAFNSGKDVHSYLASKAYNLNYNTMMQVLDSPWASIKDDDKMVEIYRKYVNYRNRAKIMWWVLLFGGGPDKIADGAGISFKEGARLQSVVYDEFPKLRDMFEEFSEFVEEHGYAETDFGFRRYLDNIKSSNDQLYHEARRQALNTPIAGTAAQITLRAVSLLDRAWRKEKLRAKNVQEVHDAVTVEVKYQDVYEVMVTSKRIMESITCPSSDGKIVFEVDTLVGAHLGTKLKVDAKILEMAKTDPKGLYELCREDLNHPPSYYI